jgi:hypothetical protein
MIGAPAGGIGALPAAGIGAVIGGVAGLAGAHGQIKRRQALQRRFRGEAQRRAMLMRQQGMARGLSGGAAAGAESQGHAQALQGMSELDMQMQQREQEGQMQSLNNLAMMYMMYNRGGAGAGVGGK